MTPEEPELLSPKQAGPLNISAYRLLYTYLLMCQSQQISVEDLNTHLLNHAPIGRTLTKDTISNYFHTLQAFGCCMTRFEEQGHVMYRLENHPLKPDLQPREAKAIQSIGNLLTQQPLTSTYKNFCFLLKRITQIPEALELNTFPGLQFEPRMGISPQIQQTVEHLQKYCIEGQMIEIGYKGADHAKTLHFVEPREIVYQKKRFYLLGNDPKTNKRVRYEVSRIETHRQLPSRIRSQTLKTTVTFKLTGRVAINYRPYPGETISHKGEFVLVKHQAEEVEQLLRRLLKYGSQCQVISPISARQEMLQLIENIIMGLESP